MRKLLVLLAVTGVSHAGPSLEYGHDVALRPAEQLQVASCDLQLELRGAIVDAWVTERVTNPGELAVGVVGESTLPAGAQLIDARVGAARGAGVLTPFVQEPASEAVGADPAIVTALAPDDHGRPRFRVIVSPIEPGHDVQLALHWTAVAEIRGGALRVTLPGGPCHGTVHATPGAGATVARLRVAGIETRGTFELGDADAEVAAELAYARPLVWTQTETLGDGHTARAITLAAPPARAPGARRVLLVIDGSRSMKLVGEPAIARVVHAIGAALPAQAEVEAILFDRTPVRALGAWRPADAATLAAIEEAVRAHVPGNGSDVASAFGLAHNLIADTRGEAMIITITDAVFGALPDDALAQALASSELAVDVHSIVLERGRLHAQNADALRTTSLRYGGSYVEVPADDLDTALAEVETWLRPSARAGDRQLLAGTGVVELEVLDTPARGTAAPIAQLALATVDHALREKLWRRHPWVDDDHALAVLASRGTVARARATAVAGGGPFTRIVDVPDPKFPAEIVVGHPAAVGGSAIDPQILDRLFKLELQPKAYVCYQRALVANHALAGTVVFHLELGRGEVTRATVDGLHDAAFDACLLDAAYAIEPPLPDPAYNVDDRTRANYPLTFAVHEAHPLVIPGDADSSSPLDIDAIRGGAPRPRHIEAGDTKNPLGGLRP